MAVVFPRASERDARVDALRVPPHSIEAEQAVLGGLMLSAEAWDKVADRLVEEDFYRRDHQLIFRAIGQLAGQSQPCDAITLGEWFEAQGLAEQVGGSAYVIELASTTPSAANIMAYADIVREKSILRNLIDVGTQIVNDAFQPAGRGSREVLEGAVPHSRDDMVIIAAMANGMRAGRLEQLTHTARIFGGLLRGKQRTAIELTTAAGMLGAVELFATGQLPQQGFVRQEQCTLPALLATRSGAYFQSLLH